MEKNKKNIEKQIGTDWDFLEIISDKINKKIPFEKWAYTEQIILLMAIFYEDEKRKTTKIPGRTNEEAKAVWLLRHLIYRPHANELTKDLYEQFLSIPKPHRKKYKTTSERIRANLKNKVFKYSFIY
jgi:hypothetical protein